MSRADNGDSSMSRMSVLVVLASAAALAAGSAQGASLNVKPGLWETSTQSQVSGMPPIPPEELAKMPPEARARMQAAMQAGMNEMNKPRTAKYCVSQEEIDKGFAAEQARHGNESCQRVVVSSSANAQTVHITCTGEGETTTGTINIVASSPEAVSGAFDFNVSGHGNNMKMHSTLTSRWLSADCGAIKPGHASVQ